MYAWWVLLQNWCTLRFSDHRGISPRTVQEGAGFWSAPERSKTIGRDKNVQVRPLYLDAACFFQHPDWFGSGWRLLSQLAPQDRDFLTGSNARTARLQRWRCATTWGFAIQGRLLAQLSDSTSSSSILIPHPVVHFWTPHSSRTFMPSSSSALGFSKSDRDYLGGWAAENSDRCARVARLKIQTMQKAVSRSFSIPASEDPLGEAETLTQLEQYMSLNLPNVPEDVRSKCLVSLGISEPETVVQKQPMVTTDTPVVEPFLLFSSSSSAARSTSVTLPSAPTDPESDGARAGAQTDRRRKTDSARTQALGSNPRERREALRAACEPGYCIYLSGKRSIRTLHCLGKCFMVPTEWTINASPTRGVLHQQQLTTTQSASSAQRAMARRKARTL